MHFSDFLVCETYLITVVQELCGSFVLVALFVEIAQDDALLGVQGTVWRIRNRLRSFVFQTCKYLNSFAYQATVHCHGLGRAVWLTSVLLSVDPQNCHGVCVVQTQNAGGLADGKIGRLNHEDQVGALLVRHALVLSFLQVLFIFWHFDGCRRSTSNLLMFDLHA